MEGQKRKLFIRSSNSYSNKQPTLVSNGQNSLPTIRFDGTNDFIQVRSLNITQAYTIYSVAKTTDAASGRDYLFDGVTTNAARSLVALRNNGNVQFWAGNWANSNFASPSGFFTLSATFNNTSSSLSLNGNTVTGKNTGSYSLTNGINIGTNYNTNADFLEGDIAEFIIVDGVSSTSERQKIEGYLAHKWGTTSALASSHPYKSSQPSSLGVSSEDFVVQGATVSNVSGSGATYTMDLTPLTNPARIKIRVAEGSATSSSTGERNTRSTDEILFRPPVMKESNLALYLPLGEPENATKVQDWGPHGLVGTVSGNPPRHPGRIGSAFRFPQSGEKNIQIPHHRSMRMDNNGAYTHNVWLRMEVGTANWGTVAGRDGGSPRARQYFFFLGNNNSADGGFIHHRFRMGGSWNAGVGDAYRVSTHAWTMVTVLNEGYPGYGKTFLNGAPIQTSTLTDTVAVEHTAAYKIGNANLKASIQNVRLYNVAFTDAEVLNLYNSVDSESGAVVINMDNIVPFNAGVPSVTQPGYSVTVSAFTPSWTATGLPTGLSIDANTGAITGTASGTPADTGTEHSVDIMATNGYGKTTRSFIMKAYPVPSSITDNGAVDLGMYGATLTGSFTDATGTNCKVHFFVDTADRGDSNVSAWAQHYILENQSPGSFSRVLSGLTFNTTYRYRMAVENIGGSLKWTTSAGTFATLSGLSAPTLGDVNASNTIAPYITPTASTATLNGTLTATGGENPTVYFVWGDNDAGTNYATLSSWDNQVPMGVLGSGSFSTNLTGLEIGKVYYFRTAASNGSGSVVSDSLGVFSVSNQGGLTVDMTTIYPNNLKLWLDANHSSASAATWTDRSNSTNNATKHGTPTVVTGQLNGLPIMRYSGANSNYHSFTRISDIRSVFLVTKYNGGYGFMLGDWSGSGNGGSYNFHGNGASAIFHSAHASANIRHADARFFQNGTAKNKYSAWGTDFSILSLVTTGNVVANNFSNDRNYNGRCFNGDLAELIVFNHPLATGEVQMVEGYLAHKWGLTGSLPSTHPFKTSLSTPVAKTITSASTASATVGSSFSYTITTDVTNPAFVVANLPPGLSLESIGTGVISGTPLSGGTYVVTIAAQSTSTNEFASSTLTITIPISGPFLAVEAPGNLVMTSAKLKGSVVSTGGRDATITVYWGDNNGSTNPSNWDNNYDLGTNGQVALAHDVTGLTGNTAYFYAFKGDNTSGGTGGTTWSPVQTFTTPSSVSTPILGTLHSVTDITSSGAKLNVNLQSTGGADSNVTLYWGDNDGGTNAANWDNSINIVNAQPGNLVGEITSGLSSPTIYFYRAKANNWTGTTWATNTSSFTPNSTQTSPTRSSNLIGWWKFDDDTNATVKDSSGNNNHGTLRNSSHALVTTRHSSDTPYGTGKSVNLNGNHYVVVSTPGEDTFDGGNQFTITSWIKEFPDGGWEPWISKRGEGGRGWQLRRYGGSKAMILTIRGPGGDDQLPASVNPDSWTHVAAVWGGDIENYMSMVSYWKVK